MILFLLMVTSVGFGVCRHEDFQETVILREGYGVIFNKVGQITDNAGINFHKHYWIIDIPNFQLSNISEINCSALIPQILGVCTETNLFIKSINSLIQTRLTDGYKLLQSALQLVPNGTIDKSVNLTRTRRSIEEKPSHNLTIRDLLPGIYIVGQIASNIFGVPNDNTLNELQQHLEHLGNAIESNTNHLSFLTDGLLSMQLTIGDRVDQFDSNYRLILNEMEKTTTDIENHHAQFLNITRNITHDMSILNKFTDSYITRIRTNTIELARLSLNIYHVYKMWNNGIITLTEGYLPRFIISHDMIHDILIRLHRHIEIYPDFRIYNPRPAYYYNIKKVMYSRTDSTLMIGINIPIITTEQDSIKTLFRIQSFPIPSRAGFVTSQNDNDYTKIINLPKFLAVSQANTYMEFTEAQYLSCNSDYQTISFCDIDTSLSHLENNDHITCAYALFIESHTNIHKSCDIGYTKSPQISTAIRTVDSSFILIGGGLDTRDWNLICDNEAQFIRVPKCDMCVYEIACRCRLNALHFIIPKVTVNCEQSAELVTLRPRYFKNTATTFNLITRDDLEELNSSAVFQHKIVTKLPYINFASLNNNSNWLEMSRGYESNYTKILELSQNNMTIYKKNVDQALAEAIDFTDTEIRSPQILSALHDAIYDIFGDNYIAKTVSVIFSTYGLSLIIFIATIILFIPRFTVDVHYCLKERKYAKSDYLLKNQYINNPNYKDPNIDYKELSTYNVSEEPSNIDRHINIKNKYFTSL